MLSTATNKRRFVGLLLFGIILFLFVAFNRFPKLDAVGTDLEAVTSPGMQCFQGLCVEKEAGTSFVATWWGFSMTYLQIVAIGMTFAFLVAGLMEVFLFPSGLGKWFQSGGLFSRTVKGAVTGPAMNCAPRALFPCRRLFTRGRGWPGLSPWCRARRL